MSDSYTRGELAEHLLEATHLSLWELFRRSALVHADSPAIATLGSVVSYKNLLLQAIRCARALEILGIRHGSRVAYGFSGCTEWVTLHYALMKLGAVGVPFNTTLQPQEIRHILAGARCEFLVAMDQVGIHDVGNRLKMLDDRMVDGSTSASNFPDLRSITILESSQSLPDRTTPGYQRVFGAAEVASADRRTLGTAEPEDIAYIIHTSGSTSLPKGAMLSNGGIAGAGAAGAVTMSLNPDDRFLGVLPPYHVAAITWLTASHWSGGSVDLMPTFDSRQAIKEIREYGCTATVAQQTNLQRMLDHESFDPAHVATLRKVIVGGSLGFYESLHKYFAFECLYSQYASTESCGLLTMTKPSLMPQGQGRPLPGIQLRIINPATGSPCSPGEAGEIIYRGWACFRGYVDGADGFDDEGFFRSGDYGCLDESGQLTYLGRYKMMVKTGGENVSEFEVEGFLEQEITGVQIAQVVGIPDPEWGEAVVAFVQFELGFPIPPGEELRNQCRGRIAGFKIPKQFYVMDGESWPLLGNGKIDKLGLRQLAATRSGSEQRQGT